MTGQLAAAERQRYSLKASRALDKLLRGDKPEEDLTGALDHLDQIGLCACWVGPRQHPRRRDAA